MEKGLKYLNKKLPIYEKRGLMFPYVTLRRDQDSYATILARLYDLTQNPKHLRKSIEISYRAVSSARKLDHVSHMAGSYWKIAKAQDVLREHLKAAESFRRASESYVLAAGKIPQLGNFYSDYASYMKAWAELEKSRHERENENYARSREHYRACSHHLEMTKRWSYLSTYYLAWSLLAHGEELSKMDKPQHARKAFNEARQTFADCVESLRTQAGKLENSEERDEASKLAALAELRKQYCTGRVLMVEAKLSSRKGDRILSAEKYASAARFFEGIAPNFEREEARTELEFAATLCQAWAKMQQAEERREPVLFRKAAELFAKAGGITPRKTARLIAVGNSCFCEALELGTKFMATSNMDFYSGSKLRMENAAGYYQRAGFQKAASWVEATKRLLDAYVYAGKAEAEAEPDKRAKLYLMAEKCLELATNLYGKAEDPSRQKEARQNLERVRKERKLALSLSGVLTAPAVLTSTTGVSMPDSTEKAAGLNDFESVNIRARLSVPHEFVPCEEFQVKLDLVNVGRKPGLLVRVEGLTPRKCRVLKVPSSCTLEDNSLNMQGRRLDPLSVETVSVWIQVEGLADLTLAPRVVYVDELGNFKTTTLEEARILPVVEFESRVAQVVFNYLVDAFVKDSKKRRLSVEKSGWRSFPQLISGARVPRRSLYGNGGRVGSCLSELQRKKLVDVRTFRGERGRGGHILRVRIHHKNEVVRRYIKNKVPDLSK
jgi:tetratricopeptide (TPR) repeat protein